VREQQSLESEQMIMKIKIVNDSFGYEVCVMEGKEMVTGERHNTLDEAQAAAKFLSVRYSAPIENLEN
jgi:hypothetical protein